MKKIPDPFSRPNVNAQSLGWYSVNGHGSHGHFLYIDNRVGQTDSSLPTIRSWYDGLFFGTDGLPRGNA